jgi:hypothetical protein
MVARKALLASFAASAARRAAWASSKSRAFSMAELSREAICSRLVSSWAAKRAASGQVTLSVPMSWPPASRGTRIWLHATGGPAPAPPAPPASPVPGAVTSSRPGS